MATDGKRLLEKVSRFREDAWLEDLDDLNFGRWDHACGWFVGSSGKRVRFISFFKLVSCYSQFSMLTHPIIFGLTILIIQAGSRTLLSFNV